MFLIILVVAAVYVCGLTGSFIPYRL